MTNDLRERLRSVDPAPVDAEPPSGAIEAVAVLHEIGRRMRMQPRETTDQPTVASGPDREDMETLDTKTTKSTDPRWRRPPLLAAAAFVVVLGIGIASAIAITGSDAEPAAPAEVATDFLQARNRYDGEAMQALLSPNALILGDLANVRSDYPFVTDFERAVGWRYFVEECSQTEPGNDPRSRVRVTCQYTWENDWSVALGTGRLGTRQVLGGLRPSVFTFTVTDGEITRLELDTDVAAIASVWNPFMEWLEGTHPDDVAIMAESNPRPGELDLPRLTDAAAALWERYTDEFVAFVEASR